MGRFIGLGGLGGREKEGDTSPPAEHTQSTDAPTLALASGRAQDRDHAWLFASSSAHPPCLALSLQLSTPSSPRHCSPALKKPCSQELGWELSE